MDADTFAPKEEMLIFETAQNIANVAQQSGYKGWSQSDGNTKVDFFWLVICFHQYYNDIRQTIVRCITRGLDIMTKDLKRLKKKLKCTFKY